MTISADFLFQSYRGHVGGTNHDGTYTLPKTVHGLGERQRGGYEKMASDVMAHFNAMTRESQEQNNAAFERYRQELATANAEIQRLQGEIDRLRKPTVQPPSVEGEAAARDAAFAGAMQRARDHGAIPARA